MKNSLTEPIADPQIAFHWLGGFIAAFLLFAVMVRVIDTIRPDNKQRTVTGIAITGGLLISIGVSPFGEFATELARIFEIIPVTYPEWIIALLTLETIFGLLYGISVMWESGGKFAVGAFVLALFGGLLIPYTPVIGVMLIVFGWMLMEYSPSEKW